MRVSRSYSRTQILAGSVFALLVVNGVWHWIANWGNITLDVDKAPLRKVIAEFQRQGHIRLRANFDLDTPVTLHLHDAPVADALENLSVVTDSRWRLAYVLGPRRNDSLAMLKDWESGTRPEGWLFIEHQVPGLEMIIPDTPDETQDPRKEEVELKPETPATEVAAANPAPAPAAAPDGAPPADGSAPAPAPAPDAAATPPPPPAPPAEPATTLVPILHRVTLLADAEAVVPKDWNPEVGTLSTNALIGKLMAKLARAGHGTAYEVFLLSKSERSQRPPGGQDAGGPPPDGGNRGGGNPMRMAQAFQARINRLPAAQRGAAQAKFDEMKAFWLSLKDLSPEDRRAKMQAMRDNPAFQDAMDQRQADRMAKMTPDQRDSRFQSYINNKTSVKGGN